MKSLVVTSIAMMLAICSFSQDKKGSTKPPAAAETAFAKAFPGATQAKWGKEEGDYEVTFNKEGKKMSAVYTSAGALKETEETINAKELPASITGYIKQHYKQDIKNAEKTVNAKGETSYEVEVGEKELVFDSNGKFIKENKD